MTVAIGVVDAVVTGSGSSTVLTPTCTANGATSNVLYLLAVTMKASDSEVITVSTSGGGDWELLTQVANTSVVVSGADTGSIRTYLYYCYGTSGVPVGTSISLSGTVGSAQAVCWSYTVAAGKAILIDYTTAVDDTYGANYSATSSTNFLPVATDLVTAITGTNSDAGAPSVIAITETGITFNATTSRVASASATGDDSRLMVYDASVASGTSSTGPTFSHTNASSAQGTTIFLKLQDKALPVLDVQLTQNPWALNPGFSLEATGLTGFDEFRVYRRYALAGDEDTVRGGQRAAVTQDAFAGEDYEFSFGKVGINSYESLSYVLEVYFAGNSVGLVTDSFSGGTLYSIFTGQLTADGDYTVNQAPKSWINCPTQPALNIPVAIETFPDHSLDANILSESHVLGRKNTVVATDVLGGMRGSFSILVVPDDGINSSAYTPPTLKGVLETFRNGQVYQMRNLAPQLVGVDDFYFVVKGIGVTRKNVRADQLADYTLDGTLPYHSVTIEYIEVDQPPTSQVVFANDWQDVNDSFGTWGDVFASNPTWLDVLTDN